jgi:hypothetical protein
VLLFAPFRDVRIGARPRNPAACLGYISELPGRLLCERPGMALDGFVVGLFMSA